MATAESKSCRICCTFLSSTHCISLFSRDSLVSGLAERLSGIAAVAQDDGLSGVICRPCNGKFVAAESFRVLAKASYDKCRASLLISACPRSTVPVSTHSSPRSRVPVPKHDSPRSRIPVPSSPRSRVLSMAVLEVGSRSLFMVVQRVHQSRSGGRDQRIAVGLGHLLTLSS